MGNRHNRRGVVLILFALSSVVIFGFMGFAIDFGRLFIARNEAQAFGDAAAMAAAASLDGTPAGIAAANNAVTGTYLTSTDQWKKYGFGSTTFASPTVQFSTDGTAFASDVGNGAAFVKVTAAAQLPMYFSTIVTGQSTRTATASAVAGQVLKTNFDEGLIPLEIMAHCTQAGAANTYGFTPCPAGTPGTPLDQTLGLYKGRQYAIRWGSNALKKADLSNWCPGDGSSAGDTNNPSFQTGIDNSNFKNDRGFWHSDGVLKADAAAYKAMAAGVLGVDLGQALPNFAQTGGDFNSVGSYLEPANRPVRFAYVPVIDPVTAKVLGVRQVQLLDSYGGGNDCWCATYVGAAVWGTGTPSVGSAGIYEVRLVG